MDKINALDNDLSSYLKSKDDDELNMVQTPQNTHKMILIEAHQSLAPMDLNREISAIMRAGPGIVALKNN